MTLQYTKAGTEGLTTNVFYDSEELYLRQKKTILPSTDYLYNSMKTFSLIIPTNAPHQIHINSHDITQTCFGKIIPSSGSTCANVKTNCK
jgi:hypothetical protein